MFISYSTSGRPQLVDDRGRLVNGLPIISGGVCPVSPVSGPVSPPPPPPGIPALKSATSTGRVAGSLWVEGTEVRYVASDKTIWGGTGTAISTPVGAIPGSMYQSGTLIVYIDASGTKRRLQDTGSAVATSTDAILGSMWLNTPDTQQFQLQWVSSSGFYQFWWNGF